MRNWLTRVMSGRNGTDHLSRACNLVACVLAILAIIGSKTWLSYLWYPALALYIYTMFRVLSRNIYQRQQENNLYLEKTQKVRRWSAMKKMQFQQRKDYAFFDCPNCKTTVRIPKGKGTVNITCPQCREKFTRKS